MKIDELEDYDKNNFLSDLCGREGLSLFCAGLKVFLSDLCGREAMAVFKSL